jgi:hypothetical protein
MNSNLKDFNELESNENYIKFTKVCKPLSLRDIWKKWYDYTHNDNIIHERGIRVIRLIDFVKEVQPEAPIQFEKLAVMCHLQITPYLAFDKVDDVFSIKMEEMGHLQYYITPVPNFSPTMEMINNSGLFGFTETHDPYVYCNDNLPNLFEPPQDMRQELPLVCGWTVSILENKWREPKYTWSAEAIEAIDLKNNKLRFGQMEE